VVCCGVQVKVAPLRQNGGPVDLPAPSEVASSTAVAGVPMPSSFLPPSGPVDASSSRPELWDNTLNFFVNGSPISVTNPDPKMLLVDYLRDVLLLKGTKVWGKCSGRVHALCWRLKCVWVVLQIGCGEGGCGACTVVLSWQNSSMWSRVFPVFRGRPKCRVVWIAQAAKRSTSL
jgi:hypothetical protein